MLIDTVYEYFKKTGNKMIKYIRSIKATILAWLAFFIFLGVSIIIGRNKTFFEFLAFLCILELPMIYLFPLCCQTVKFYKIKVSTGWWFIKFRTFLWSEVYETGLAYTRDKRTGAFLNEKFVYISKRPVTNKKDFFILGVRNYRKNFITLENRGNVIEDIKKYSGLLFRDLPTTEDF